MSVKNIPNVWLGGPVNEVYNPYCESDPNLLGQLIHMYENNEHYVFLGAVLILPTSELPRDKKNFGPNWASSLNLN